ncbi:MAG TPA: hypothetical protein VGM90_11445 [Kofleriaceae bacterium]|jgi:hypothetical protein
MDFLSLLGDSKDAAAGGLAIAQAIAFVAGAYFFIQWDKNRTGSANKDDTQVGLKLVLFAIILASISILTGGVEHLLGFILGGFKGGSMPVRASLPPIIVGGGAVFVVLKMLLPRTNHAEYPQSARFTVGWLALTYGVASVIHVYGFLMGLFTGAEWYRTSSELGAAFVSIAFAFPALRSFGGMSNWTEPPPPANPYGAYPGGPSGPNMGVPGSGMPPGGSGGYGPPGGGAPPGGGYGPPGGGGAPPGGGGYGPPGGGGGYGPPGGGGAPPGGGGYGPPGGGGAPPGGGFGPGGGSGGGYPPR